MKKIIPLLMAISSSAFAGDCDKLDITGIWHESNADFGRAETVTEVIASDMTSRNPKIALFNGTDTSTYSNCFGPSTTIKTYYSLSLNRETCVINQHITRVTRTEGGNPIEKETAMPISPDSAFKLLESSITIDNEYNKEKHELVLSNCEDQACKVFSYKNPLVLIRYIDQTN